MGRSSVKGSGRYFVWNVPGTREGQDERSLEALVRRLLAENGQEHRKGEVRSRAAIFPEYVI
ncbi:MAG: hypothetical protein MOGMAGMI_01718 [Candidatus Omnitrophica bacterium]|nr:hypothetical protein [Candidatus Omnitrophota bacterium]